MFPAWPDLMIAVFSFALDLFAGRQVIEDLDLLDLHADGVGDGLQQRTTSICLAAHRNQLAWSQGGRQLRRTLRLSVLVGDEHHFAFSTWDGPRFLNI